MKKSIIALFIVFLFVSALSAYSADEGNAETSTSEENALDYQESYEQGFFDARSTYDGGNWGWYGFGGGLLLNLVGAGIIVAVASMETINPKHIPDWTKPLRGIHHDARSQQAESGTLSSLLFLSDLICFLE